MASETRHWRHPPCGYISHLDPDLPRAATQPPVYCWCSSTGNAAVAWEPVAVLPLAEAEALQRLKAAVDSPDVESLARAVHAAYCDDFQTRKGEHYWTHGDYTRLDDKDRETDRATVRAVLAALRQAMEVSK